ncbi:MAG: hypothetical protein RL318_2318 [Fibrobacterota bacterium]|jgi:putative ABC transport system permease protein
MTSFLASIWVGMSAALREMRVQPLRSALSMTGVGLAIAALTALLSIIGGLNQFIRVSSENMGGPGRFTLRSQEASTPAEIFQFSRSQGTRAADIPNLEESMDGAVNGMKSASQWNMASAGGILTRVNINGIDEEYLDRLLKVKVEQGRLFTKEEFLRGDPVCVLGWEVADRLAGKARSRGDSLVGSSILLSGVRYRVIGRITMERNGGWRYAVAAFVPWNAMTRFHLGPNPKLDNLQLQASSPDSVQAMLPALNAAVRGLHRGAEDFTFELFNFLKEFQAMIGNVTLLFSFVAALSLGVGALGIFNVMLASLNDRVREVGVRKALGAKPLEIGVQFLAESITLAIVGGLVGMALGAFPLLLGDALEKSFSFRPLLDLPTVLKALGITIATGVLSGLYPAWKAMRLDPIEALRYE